MDIGYSVYIIPRILFLLTRGADTSKTVFVLLKKRAVGRKVSDSVLCIEPFACAPYLVNHCLRYLHTRHFYSSFFTNDIMVFIMLLISRYDFVHRNFMFEYHDKHCAFIFDGFNHTPSDNIFFP